MILFVQENTFMMFSVPLQCSLLIRVSVLCIHLKHTFNSMFSLLPGGQNHSWKTPPSVFTAGFQSANNARNKHDKQLRVSTSSLRYGETQLLPCVLCWPYVCVCVCLSGGVMLWPCNSVSCARQRCNCSDMISVYTRN